MDHAEQQKGTPPLRQTPGSAGGTAGAGAHMEGVDQETIHLVSEAIYWIKVAVVDIRLYPSGSAQALKATESAFGPITTLLENAKHLSLGTKDGKLLVNGTLYKHRDVAEASSLQLFANMLAGHGISSITFMHGVTVQELHTFLDGLSNKRFSRENIQELTQKLHQEGVTHVALNEQVYVAVGTDDLVIKKGQAVLDESSVALDRVMKGLNETMEMVGGIQDQSVRDKTKLEIAQKLIQADPGLFRQIMTGESHATGGGTAQTNNAGYTPEDFREIVGDLARLYQEEKAGAAPGQDIRARLEQIKRIINKLLSLCGQNAIVMTMYKKLLETGELDVVPPWIRQTPGTALSPNVAKAEELIQKDHLLLLHTDVRDSLAGLVRALDLEQQSDVIVRLVKHLCEGAMSGTANVRHKTVAQIVTMLPVFKAIGNPNILKGTQDLVTAMMDQETDPEVYREIGVVLESAFRQAVLERDYVRCGRVVAMLRRHSLDSSGGFIRRNSEAETILARLVHQETVRTLIAELLSGHPESHHARDILLKFGVDVAPIIVSEITTSQDRAALGTLTDLLASIGDDGIALLVDEIVKTREVHALRHLLDAAAQLGLEHGLFEGLKTILLDPDPARQMEVLKVIARMKNAQARKLLCIALQDRDHHVVMEAMRLACQLAGDEIVNALIGIMREKSESDTSGVLPLQEAAIRALGRIGSDRAIPDLIEIARHRGMFDQLKKNYTPVMRCEAIRALTRFYRHPDVQKMLQELRNDPEPQVQKMAEHALHPPARLTNPG